MITVTRLGGTLYDAMNAELSSEDDAAEPTHDTLPGVIEALTKDVNALTDAIERLQGKLEPITYPCGDPSDKDTDVEMTSPLRLPGSLVALNALHHDILALARRIEGLMECLAL